MTGTCLSADPSTSPFRSVPGHKRTRSLAESRRCHAPSRHGDSQQSTRAKRKGENTPEARRRGTYERHRLLLTKERARAGGQRAATASATARRAKRAANATTVAPSSPTGAGSSDRAAPARASTCFAMAVALLCACSKRRRGVHIVPLLACSIRRAALKINAAARKHSPRRLDWFNLGTVRCTVQNPRRHLYAFIRGAPPDAPDRQQKYFFSDSLNLLTLLPPVVISFTLRLRTRRRGPLRTRAAALPS